MSGQPVAYICEFETIVSINSRSFMSWRTHRRAAFFVGNFWDIFGVFALCRGTGEECLACITETSF